MPTPDPEIGYFEQRSAFRTALDNGELIAPTADADQMQQVITNSTVNGVLQAAFALLTLVVVLGAIPIWLKAVRSGGLPTTEEPHEPSNLVAPADFFATKEVKEAVRRHEQGQRELTDAGAGDDGCGAERLSRRALVHQGRHGRGQVG